MNEQQKRRPGRPKQFGPTLAKRGPFWLEDETLAALRVIGDGNATQGIRRAVHLATLAQDLICVMYGRNLMVANWHQNGELEPVDNFFEENGLCPAAKE